MAKMEKYTTGIVGVIKHNIREFKDGICPTNLEVNPGRSMDNYSLISRGKTAAEIDRYRKRIEKECFHYNRKNLVHAVEIVCTLPKDCPPDQEERFFEESFKYICSTLPMGEKCIFLAEVHCDEGKVLFAGGKDENGNQNMTIVEGSKHMHVMYVPAVPDTKHEAYEFKLCADELTRRSVLLKWHPNYQKWLDDAHVHATVSSGVTTGKGISVKALKEITKETGLSLQQVRDLSRENERLRHQLHELQHTCEIIAEKDHLISELRDTISAQKAEIDRLQTIELSRSEDHTWGHSAGWGKDHSWGKDIDRDHEW